MRNLWRRSRWSAPLVLFVTLLIAPGIASAATVSWWQMDETSGSTMHDSVGTNDGSLHSVLVGQAGFAGLAYRFNGSSSYVRVPSASNLIPQSAAFWFGARVKFTGDPAKAPGGDYDIVRKGQAASGASFYKLELFPGGRVHCSIGGSTGSTSHTAGPDLRGGSWHTILCLKDAGSISVVVDGRVFSTGATIGSISTGDDLAVGANLEGRDWYEGLADDVAFGTGAPPPPPTAASAPAITGTAAPGGTLSASPGTWNGSPVSVRYQWQRCDAAGGSCSDVAGATGTTYAVTAADNGHTVRVVVVASNPTGLASAASAPSAVIGPPPAAGPPAPGPGAVGVTPIAGPSPQPGQAVAGLNTAGPCVRVRTASHLRTSALRGGGVLALRLATRTRTVSVRAVRAGVQRIVLSLDRRRVRTVHGHALRAVLPASRLRPGRHVLRTTAFVAGRPAGTLAMRITARTCG